MSMLPAISIVTPSFNQGQYLEECIESVLGQGYPRLEYVIMDGGSNDGSVEIIRKYEKYLTYWQSCPDGGQYRAISEGFRHTSGEIMAWLNADDKYHPLAFAKVACTFAAYPEVEWLTGRKSFWDAVGNLATVESGLGVFSQRKFLEGHFNKPYIQQESTFWRRTLWERAGGGLDADVTLAGDLDLWLRFFRSALLYTVDTLLGGYRFHGDQRGVKYADRYRQEGEACVARERQTCRIPGDQLQAPPSPIMITRERLASFIAEIDLKPAYPNHRRCWSEYTEDLIAAVQALSREQRVEQVPFWHNEIALFSLAKPRAALLLADHLAALNTLWERVRALLAEARRYEAAGALHDALESFREAAGLAPCWPAPAAALLRCLSAGGSRPEALGRLSAILARHAHDPEVVRAAVALLVDCGAKAQAREVCDEYLMVNPHDDELRAGRNVLSEALR